MFKLKNIILFLGVFIILVASVSEARSQELEAFVRRALDENPRIEAAYQQWQAQIHKVTQEGAFPDPKASYGYFGEYIETRTGPQEEKYGVSQRVPFPGKLTLKRRIQEKVALAAGLKYESVRREVVKDVKRVYYELFWIDRAIEITEEKINLDL